MEQISNAGSLLQVIQNMGLLGVFVWLYFDLRKSKQKDISDALQRIEKKDIMLREQNEKLFIAFEKNTESNNKLNTTLQGVAQRVEDLYRKQ